MQFFLFFLFIYVVGQANVFSLRLTMESLRGLLTVEAFSVFLFIPKGPSSVRAELPIFTVAKRKSDHLTQKSLERCNQQRKSKEMRFFFSFPSKANSVFSEKNCWKKLTEIFEKCWNHRLWRNFETLLLCVGVCVFVLDQVNIFIGSLEAHFYLSTGFWNGSLTFSHLCRRKQSESTTFWGLLDNNRIKKKKDPKVPKFKVSFLV